MALSHFITKSWIFKHDKLLWLRTQVPACDSMHFKMDGLDTLDHREYFKAAILGAKLYLLKEGADTLPSARRHYIR
jgi:hypothetical protein